MTPALSTNRTYTSLNFNLFIVILIAFILYSAVSQYMLLSIFGGVSLIIILTQVWKPYVPPVLLYFFGFHWLQIFSVIFYSDYKGESIDSLFTTQNSEFLIAITLVQLVCMVIAAGFLNRSNIHSSVYSLLKGAAQLNTKKIIFGYLVCTLIFPFLLAFTRSNASLNQLVQSFSVFRSIFLILLAFILFLKKEYRALIISIFFIEFILGFVSYFSSFKDVILYILLVYLTINSKIKAGLIVKLSPLIILLGFVFIFWSYVKPVYREFLNGGSGQQQVTVSTSEALGFLGKELNSFNKESFDSGTETFLLRIQAMAYYLEIYDRVPKVIPFEKGKNLESSVDFLLVPRFLKQSKGILDPSSKLIYYTGRRFATAEEGTSIAMGYFCDFFVDYGIWWMFIPIIILGIILGWGANFILKIKKYNILFKFSLLIGFFLSMGTMESDITFMLGVMRNLFVVFLLGNWFLFPWINKQITS